MKKSGFRSINKSHVLEDLFEIRMVDFLSKLFADIVVDKSIVFVFDDALELLHFLGRVVLLLLQELLLEGWVRTDGQLRGGLSGHEVETHIVLEVIGVIVADFLADGLVGDLVDVLVVARVDRTVHQKQVYQLSVVLLNHILKHTVCIWVSSVLEQMLGDGVVVLGAILDEAQRVFSHFLVYVCASVRQEFH